MYALLFLIYQVDVPLYFVFTNWQAFGSSCGVGWSSATEAFVKTKLGSDNVFFFENNSMLAIVDHETKQQVLKMVLQKHLDGHFNLYLLEVIQMLVHILVINLYMNHLIVVKLLIH